MRSICHEISKSSVFERFAGKLVESWGLSYSVEALE